MNKKFILKVARAIEDAAKPSARPKVGFNMLDYIARGANWVNDESGHHCKTTACIAGWAVTMASEKYAEHDLSKQVAAARVLRNALETLTEDAEAIRDTLEGELDLSESIARVMAIVREDQTLLAGLEVMLKTLGERKSRFENRIDRMRDAITDAMLTGEIPSLKLPDATLSISNPQRKIIVTDETKIPAKFFKPQPAKLDKKALNEAIRAGEDIAGTTLGNRSATLTIRRA